MKNVLAWIVLFVGLALLVEGVAYLVRRVSYVRGRQKKFGL